MDALELLLRTHEILGEGLADHRPGRKTFEAGFVRGFDHPKGAAS